MATDCKVWHMYQARCLLCDWAGEVTGVDTFAARDARDHRATAEHQRNLAERREPAA